MPRGAKPKTYPAEIVECVRALYETGLSQAEVAAQIGVTQKIVWRLMERHGIPRRPAIKRDQRGEKNSSWRGGRAGYQALHVRVQQLRGKPQKCSRCGVEGPGRAYDWANLTGEYDNPADYERMCRSCHWKYDEKIKNLGSYGVRKGAPIP